MLKSFVKLFIIIVVVFAIVYTFIGVVVRKPDVILKEDPEFLYVRKYTLHNRDSVVYKYHWPITHKGVVIQRSLGMRIGNQYVSWTRIGYSVGKTHKVPGYFYYRNHKVGDTVHLKEIFYPTHEIQALD